MSDEQKRRAAGDAADSISDAGSEAAAKASRGSGAGGRQAEADRATPREDAPPPAAGKGGGKPAARQTAAPKQSAAAKGKAARRAGAVDQVSVSDGALAKIIGLSAHEVPGVVGMAPASFSEGIRRILGTRQVDEGVVLARSPDGLTADVDMHVVVAYGVNIPVVAASVRDRVRYAAKQLAGIELKKIRVHVAGVSRA